MKRTNLLKSIIGEELCESLNKALVKLGTKSVVDLEELHSAIKTVPKSILAFLMKELKDLKKDETKEVRIPWDNSASMVVTKLDADVYKGKIFKDSKVIHEFDLTAMPQLAAHIMSCFEIYDEHDEESSSSSSSSSHELRDRVASLENKIDSLLMGWASRREDVSKAEVKKTEESKKGKIVKALKKAGIGPKMPSPPRAGTKVGGNAGTTKMGLHGDKTPHSDLNAKPKTQTANPYMKGAANTAKSEKEKILILNKSDLDSSCGDCGNKISDCVCFKALSKPEIKKSEDGKVILKFRSDWDMEAVAALYKSVKRRKSE